MMPRASTWERNLKGWGQIKGSGSFELKPEDLVVSLQKNHLYAQKQVLVQTPESGPEEFLKSIRTWTCDNVGLRE